MTPNVDLLYGLKAGEKCFSRPSVPNFSGTEYASESFRYISGMSVCLKKT